jgi:hypothetical protein
MESTFWRYTAWYILLAMTSAIAIVTILLKTRERRKTLAFWQAVLGFRVMLVFQAYIYHPMLVPDEFFDAVLGNVFSQVSVSSSAVLICVLGLSNWWLGGFSVAYFLTDLLYSHLGVYQHFWYRSVYTLAGFFIYGLIVKRWYKKFFGGPSKRLYVSTQFLSVWAVSGNVFGTFFRLIDLRVFQSGLYENVSRDHTATGLIYSAVMAITMIALYRWGTRWWYKFPVFLLLLAGQLGLVYSGVIVTLPGWEIPIVLIDLAGYYSLTVLLGRLLQGGKTRCLSGKAKTRIVTGIRAHTNSMRGIF